MARRLSCRPGVRYSYSILQRSKTCLIKKTTSVIGRRKKFPIFRKIPIRCHPRKPGGWSTNCGCTRWNWRRRTKNCAGSRRTWRPRRRAILTCITRPRRVISALVFTLYIFQYALLTNIFPRRALTLALGETFSRPSHFFGSLESRHTPSVYYGLIYRFPVCRIGAL